MRAEPDARPAEHVRVVDGLRGIAILLVLLFHYWQLSWWWVLPVPGRTGHNDLEFLQYAGFLGVELFFFISAFCLTYPHAKAMLGLGPVPTVRRFFYRRAIKILPSYLLALAVLGTFFADLYPTSAQRGGAVDTGLHLVFLHNLFPDTTGSFAGVLWSLALEVQFYYLFPVLARAFRRAPWRTTAVMVGVAVAYRSWARGRPIGDFGHIDALLPGFLDLFALGMLTAYLVVWIRQRAAAVRRLRPAFTVIAVAAAAVLLFLFRWVYDLRFDGPPGVWQSINRSYLAVLFACLTVASTFAVGPWRSAVGNRVLVFLSTISYNLYIWHQVVGALIRNRGWWPDAPGAGDPHPGRWAFVLVSVTASVSIATLVTYAFERPLLRLGVRGALRELAARTRRRPKASTLAPGPRVGSDVG